jgi:ATP-binding cassette, subfamily C, bacterial CydD
VIAVQIGIRLLYGQMDFQQAFFLLVIAPEFYLPLRQLGVRFHAAQNGVNAARRIFTVLDQPEEITIQCNTKPDLNQKELFHPPFHVQFEDVTFVYPGRVQEAVSHVSFELKSGETAALLGLNGSGKSTLASLLLRFIHPQSGTIFFNGVDIQTIPIQIWRAGIAYLNQQPVLFNETLRQNLMVARTDATDPEVIKALEDAHLLKTIKTLPHGLDSELGENAYRFSGGQVQRLGLARTFLKNAPLLILDEPTSHMDVLLETEMDESLKELRKNHTCLIIAHRKETARQADRVLMMEKGLLICSGRHTDLINSDHHYAALFAGGSPA